MAGPSFSSTILPVLALGAGVAIGAYLIPPGTLPGTERGEDGSPTAERPSPVDAARDVIRDVSSLFRRDDGGGSGGETSAGSGSPSGNAVGGDENGNGSPGATTADRNPGAGSGGTPSEVHPSTSGERAPRVDPGVLNRSIATVVRVLDGATIEVRTRSGSLAWLRLYGLDPASTNTRFLMQRELVGLRGIVQVLTPEEGARPIDSTGRVHAAFYWVGESALESGEGVALEFEESVNFALQNRS